SYWRIGGEIEGVVRPSTVTELVETLDILHRYGYPYLIAGNRTNVLFTDSSITAVLIILGDELSRTDIDKNTGRVIALAGAWMPTLARKIGKAGLAGAEHLIGIPGSLGGLVVMNGGSNQHSISESIYRVDSLTKDGAIISRTKEECDFAYRKSCFQENGEIVLKAVMQFEPNADRIAIKKDMLQVLRSRRRKFPLRFPNCGSVFMADKEKFDELGAPGRVLESIGLKGKTLGGAQISHLHANFIVNTGGAKASDVLGLVKLSIETVKQAGVDYQLLSEIKFIDQ